MGKRRNRVCGADVHKDIIVATILSADGTELQEKFGTTSIELKRFRDWLIAHKCEQVAFEATGVYWFPVYDALSPSIDTIVANPWMIKGLLGDKSDSHDAKRIADNCLDGKIKRSRVFSNEDRDLRNMTRARSGYIKTRTQLRNRIHKYLALCGIKLSSSISDIFGKSGRHILDGLVEGKDIDAILDSIPSGQIKKKRDLIKISLGKGLDKVSRMLVKDTLELLDHLEKKIEKTSLEVLSILQKRPKDLAIVMSVPGIGFISASIILAEIGNYHDFSTPGRLVKWCGLAPGLNESAGKKIPCGITKQGSKSLRTILVEIAQVVAKMKNNRLSRFFNRLRARKNYNVAITALARKLISLIYHLLTQQELYQENNCNTAASKPVKEDLLYLSKEERLKDGVAAIVDAFYHLKNRYSEGGE
jgi:transposase